MRLTIARKVLLGNLLMIGAVVGGAFWIVNDLRKVDEHLGLAADAQEQLLSINSVADDIDRARRAWGHVIVRALESDRSSLVTPEITSQRRYANSLRAPRDSVLMVVSRSRFGERASIQSSIEALRVAARDLDQVFDEAERLARSGLPDEAEAMLHRWHEPDERLQNALSTLQQHAREDARNLVQSAAEFRQRMIRRVATIALLVVALLLGTVFLLNRSIRRSTKRLSNTLSAVAEGNFGDRARLESGDEFEEIADGVNAMSRRLGELDELKADFLSNVSHELRTPIASVKQSALLLEEEVVGKLSPDQREIVGIVRSNAQRLGALINDLLDTAKLEAGKLDIVPERVDMRDLIRRSVATVSPLAKEKQLRVSMKPNRDDVTAMVDPTRMEQVLINLLSNAIKFTPEGGAISLTCEHRGETVVCAVADTGVGIPATELPTIFDKFHQAKAARTSQVKGTGLGLTIVRYILEAHGGSIDVTSEVGVGTTFTFSVPSGAEIG